ncbi:hypothetical protein DL98DRAFT_624293 [Cadophora sp. DSE1049]|nr:hypothetical protein DL98DRAFT_624293 [Cadophora sp. DSE1049]
MGGQDACLRPVCPCWSWWSFVLRMDVMSSVGVDFAEQKKNIIQGWPERTGLPTHIRHPSQKVSWLKTGGSLRRHIWAGLARNILTADKVCRTPFEKAHMASLRVVLGVLARRWRKRAPPSTLVIRKVSSSQEPFTQAPKGQAHGAPPWSTVHGPCSTATTAVIAGKMQGESATAVASDLRDREVDGRVSGPVCDGSGLGPMNGGIPIRARGSQHALPATRMPCVARLLKSRYS